MDKNLLKRLGNHQFQRLSDLEKEISEIKNSLQSDTITTSWHKVRSQMNQNLIELEHENSTTMLDLKN